ncbi:MAG: bifunctional diaminohydroxyphosphoribosylaminopyrimidine deaminase/5-amino-6-(5-phosphoribosylamino)uracil reductase RibD [Gammaproteobacteria bacterium]|jgi:diaminohydroxyphosphoribosylaminopyrimidine deaminase/5-amino-6-(5-phosphoribosylamino)uracil reductase|nr:bifunctional diaminohydroxyphosphoribosylaminopyrimidine deaminase/5-amino-6-(5-phosphoribosylamino)uracil reductase RibD [Gammaproteobacteria bacterium]|tara:strand:+ start:3410 stop:4456 length:1047 start_codon:yes stop_codon:yes gene_type:complete
METFSINDTKAMAIALRIAKKGVHGVKANPMVGCVITRDEKVISQGYHKYFGEAHAEANALKKIDNKASNATLYVTLEPCAHKGKTPSCAQTIINSGAKKVVIATLDPNPLVNGRGMQMLIDAGIEVKVGLLETEAKELNRGFIHRMQTEMPFVTCKIAMSIDGKSSMASGESKWITSEDARIDVQHLRSNNQAILTGYKTILKDNPRLTVRLDNANSSPLRVVIDGNNKIKDKSLNIFSNDAQTLVLNTDNTKRLNSGKLDLRDALCNIAEKGVNYVLLESGPGLVGAMIEANLINEFIIYIAPILMGNNAKSMNNLLIDHLSDKIKLSIKDIRMVGEDIKITASIR